RSAGRTIRGVEVPAGPGRRVRDPQLVPRSGEAGDRRASARGSRAVRGAAGHAFRGRARSHRIRGRTHRPGPPSGRSGRAARHRGRRNTGDRASRDQSGLRERAAAHVPGADAPYRHEDRRMSAPTRNAGGRFVRLVRRTAILCATVALATCMDATDVELLQINATGSVAGEVYLDLNGTGQPDAGDQPLAGVRVVLSPLAGG